MSQDQWTDRLSEYVDGDMTGEERSELERHLEGCDACARAVTAVRGVVRRAEALVDRAPANDLWDGIAERIGASPAWAPPARPEREARRPWRRRVSVGVPQLLAAGIALAIFSGGGVWLAVGRAAPEGVTAGPAPVPIVPVSASPAAAPTATAYDAAIADLLALLEAERETLDPTTVRILEANLAVIDRAIERSRLALLADPESEYLREHLEGTKRRKLTLLQRVNAIASAL